VDKGNYLPGVPQTTLFAEVNWKPTDWVSTAVEGMYRSKVYVEDTNSKKAHRLTACSTGGRSLSRKVEHWTFHQTLRLDNLLDRQYVGSVIVGRRQRTVLRSRARPLVVRGRRGAVQLLSR
jgi:iron complex outermembrane recepter protein